MSKGTNKRYDCIGKMRMAGKAYEFIKKPKHKKQKYKKGTKDNNSCYIINRGTVQRDSNCK